jgi:hypothetical protein
MLPRRARLCGRGRRGNDPTQYAKTQRGQTRSCLVPDQTDDQGRCPYCGGATNIRRRGRRVHANRVRWNVHTCTLCKKVSAIHERAD